VAALAALKDVIPTAQSRLAETKALLALAHERGDDSGITTHTPQPQRKEDDGKELQEEVIRWYEGQRTVVDLFGEGEQDVWRGARVCLL